MSMIRILEETVRPLETVPRMARVLGATTRKTAGRWAESQGWPLHGGMVSVPQLADMLGIPYEIVTEKEAKQ